MYGALGSYTSVGDNVSNYQCKWEADDAEDKVEEEAMPFATRYACWPKCNGDPNKQNNDSPDGTDSKSK